MFPIKQSCHPTFRNFSNFFFWLIWLKLCIVIGKLNQEWRAAEEKFIWRWSVRYHLSNSSRKKFHLHFTSERSNRKLFLLPICWLSKGSWWLWRHQDSQQALDSCSIPWTCWRFHCSYWWLVQGQSQCKWNNLFTCLWYCC